MSDLPIAPPEPLRAFVFVARLLRLTLRSWWSVLPWLLVPALLFTLPAIPYEFHDFTLQLTKPITLDQLPHPWTLLVRMFAALTLHGAAALLVLAQLRGEPLSIGALLGALGRLFLPMVATEVVLVGVVMVWLIPGAVLGSLWPAAALLLLLALWPVVVFSLAIPIVAVERLPRSPRARSSASTPSSPAPSRATPSSPSWSPTSTGRCGCARRRSTRRAPSRRRPLPWAERPQPSGARAWPIRSSFQADRAASSSRSWRRGSSVGPFASGSRRCRSS
jgi:hypothetical protein